ncbi:hypothetical protein LIER_12649 [Lithospermum erythrorhizon]|uniref:Retroviral polymerase SH3-like domain-containing protein n=1 Tax=Lithospermum erythrorhizon TaxID=34254 RepID=A0AAV3PWN7_LITER
MSNEKLVRKVLSTLPKWFAHKVTTIVEAQDLSTMGFDELIGNLTTFEMMFEATEPSKEKGVALQKFDVKSDEGIFLGYSRKSRALRMYNKQTQVVVESINVKVGDQEISTTKEEDVSLVVNPSVDHSPSDEVPSVKPVDDDSGIEPAARIQKNHPVENIIGEVD